MNGSGDCGAEENKEKEHTIERTEEDQEERAPRDDEAGNDHCLLPKADSSESHHDQFDGKKYEEDFAEGDPLDCCTCVTWDNCCRCIPEPNRTRLKYVLVYLINLIVYLASAGFIYLDLGLDIYYMVTFLHRRGYMIALGLSAVFMALSMLVTAVVNNTIRFDRGEIGGSPSQNGRWAKVKHICKRLGYLFLDFPLPQLHVGYTLFKQSFHKIKLFCMALSCCQSKEQLEKNLTDIHNWNQQASRGLSARPTTAYSLGDLIRDTGPEEQQHNGSSQHTGDNVPKTKSDDEDGEEEEKGESDRFLDDVGPGDDLDTSGQLDKDDGRIILTFIEDDDIQYDKVEGGGQEDDDEEEEEEGVTYTDEAAGFFKSPYNPPKFVLEVEENQEKDICDGVDHVGFFKPAKQSSKDLKEDAERSQAEGLDVLNTERENNLVEMSIASDFYIARIKLLESLLEAAPQLLINLFIMMRYHDNIETIQIVVSVVAFLSFVWGIVQFERQSKTNGCFEHTKRYRSPNRMEISQTCFVFLYKALLLGARFLSLVYFTSTFTVAILAVVLPHFFLSVIWLTYNRVHSGVFKLWDESVAMKEKWQHFLMITINSVLNIFLYFHDMYPTWESPSILLHADMVIYYLFFTIETSMMILFPLERNRHMTDRHYYFIMAAVLLGLVLGLVLMLIYYTCVHKSKKAMRHRYFGIFYRNKDKKKAIPYRDYHTKNIKMIARGDVERGNELAMGEMYRETYLECRRKGMCIVSTPEGVYKMVPLAGIRGKKSAPNFLTEDSRTEDGCV